MIGIFLYILVVLVTLGEMRGKAAEGNWKDGRVLVYNGDGTTGVAEISTVLSRYLDSRYTIQSVDAETLNYGEWTKDTVLLIIPGGRDLPYVRDLSPGATAIIRDFVKNGGKYMGICAGAYFASARVEFEVGRKGYQVIGNRDLKLVDAVTIGSVTPNYVYGDPESARVYRVKWENDRQLDEAYLYVSGGPTFLVNNTLSSAFRKQRVVGWYMFEDYSLPAVVVADYGNGKVYLQGTHFEFDPTTVMSSPAPPLGNEVAIDRYIKNMLKVLEMKLEERTVLAKI